jgi:hypothetical protein
MSYSPRATKIVYTLNGLKREIEGMTLDFEIPFFNLDYKRVKKLSS